MKVYRCRVCGQSRGLCRAWAGAGRRGGGGIQDSFATTANLRVPTAQVFWHAGAQTRPNGGFGEV